MSARNRSYFPAGPSAFRTNASLIRQPLGDDLAGVLGSKFIRRGSRATIWSTGRQALSPRPLARLKCTAPPDPDNGVMLTFDSIEAYDQFRAPLIATIMHQIGKHSVSTKPCAAGNRTVVKMVPVQDLLGIGLTPPALSPDQILPPSPGPGLRSFFGPTPKLLPQ